ncbi:MAG: hypothetical protein HY064_06050 [Bacteroidetes bacterium]|nr:hypothetical protein [Bacteroidota bacterium]
MSINNLKKVLFSKIAETKDEEILRVVYRILDNCNEVYQMSAEEINAVNEAQAEYEKGECISDEDFQKEFEKWLKK